jgi:hypothetical protein
MRLLPSFALDDGMVGVARQRLARDLLGYFWGGCVRFSRNVF